MKKSIYVLYLTIVAVLAAATIIAENEGIDYAKEEIYGAWWFAALWTLLVTAGMCYIFRRKVRSIPTLLLHLSFVFILLGAFITHISGKQGSIHLRKGSFSVFYNSEDGQQRLPFAIRLDNFSVQLYTENGNVADYISDITIADMDHNILKQGSVSMNNILEHKGWRFYQWSYDDDGMGASLVINRDPLGIAVTYVGYILLFLSFGIVVVGRCRKIIARRREMGRMTALEKSLLWTASLLSSAIILFGAYFFVTQMCDTNPWIADMRPILNSPWLSIHVSIISVAYLLLLLALIVSLIALCGGNACRLMHISLLMLYPAMSLLAAGIFIGAIWANVSWGNYWSWDPKEVWALITMMIYAIALHGKSIPSLRTPRVYHRFMALAFLTILMTFFGVNYFLVGMHSYV